MNLQEPELKSREDALQHAISLAHHFYWNSDYQDGHTKKDWADCEEWPCNILKKELEMNLQEAWDEVESLLPEGWYFNLGDWKAEPNRKLPRYEALAEPYDLKLSIGMGTFVEGETSVEALQKLAEKLRAINGKI